MSGPKRKKTYDHRLRELVRQTGDVSIATERGVPRSTAAGWVRTGREDVVSIDVLDMREVELQAEVLRLRRRLRSVSAIIALLVVLVRTSGCSLEKRSHLDSRVKASIVRTVERARHHLSLGTALRIVGLSTSRFHAWKRGLDMCRPAEGSSCPRKAPNQLTLVETQTIRDMVTSPDYRHVPTSRLALLAQRLGKVFASPATWAKLIRERGWRRPRLRVHPAKPKIGLRTSRPNEAWHVDTTIIRLLDGTKAYVHGVIDNFSRRILAFRVSDSFQVANALAVLEEAVDGAVGSSKTTESPQLVVDGGVENFNGDVDDFVATGTIHRVLAQADIVFSNSLIEAFWRSLKHQWLFMNTLDTVTAVRRQVTFYVESHNSQIPHSALDGRTPDEVYFGRGEEIPETLAVQKKAAQKARLEVNRSTTCACCSGPRT